MRDGSRGGDGKIGGAGGGSLGRFGGQGHQVKSCQKCEFTISLATAHYQIKLNGLGMKGKRRTRFISTNLFLKRNSLEVWWV